MLFPHGLLPLRIFETRYVDMIRRVMREGAGFGVVLIRAGAEVGDVDQMAKVGTWAQVIDFGQMPDGLLKIVARGERRFRIIDRDTQPDGLHMANVEWLEDAIESPLAAGEWRELRAGLVDALAALDEEYPAGPERREDAAWVAGHLGQLLPLPAEVRQKLLETRGARQRLELIEQMRQQAGPGNLSQ